MIKQCLINENKTPIGLRLDEVVPRGSLHSFENQFKLHRGISVLCTAGYLHHAHPHTSQEILTLLNN